MGSGRERGIALIMVLWVFMVLGVLALDFGRYVRDDAMAAVNFAEETQGYYVALAGMNRTLFAYSQEKLGGPILGAQGDPGDPEDIGLEDLRIPPDTQWHADTFGGSHYEVKLTDESGLIPINGGNLEVDDSYLKDMLTCALRYMMQHGNRTTGMSVDDTKRIDTIVDSILDWRDRKSEERTNGAERDCAFEHDRAYRAPNRKFWTREELLGVCGMTPELFYGTAEVPGLRDLVSIWRKDDKDVTINPLLAPVAVLEVLTGDAAKAAELVALRDADKTIFAATVLNFPLAPECESIRNNVKPSDSKVVFIEARADTQAPRNRAHIAAVVDLHSEQGTEVVQPMAWFDRAPWTEPIAGPQESEDAAK
jgi:general secretion pathway protein K